jgi:hypothetical protein
MSETELRSSAGTDYSDPPMVRIGPRGAERWSHWLEHHGAPYWCPRIARSNRTIRWTSCSSVHSAHSWAEPIGWQGGYVALKTDCGPRLWTYEEFWEWVDDTQATPREMENAEVS